MPNIQINQSQIEIHQNTHWALALLVYWVKAQPQALLIGLFHTSYA